MFVLFMFLFKQKTAYEMRISDWSSDVCSSDLQVPSGKKSLPRVRLKVSHVRSTCSFIPLASRRGRISSSVTTEFARTSPCLKASGPSVNGLRTVSEHTDRKSGVEGKRVSVKVDTGGGRNDKKHKKKVIK